MEILQTIWTAITTPNEIITKLQGIPLIFLEAYISMTLFTTILNIESTRKQKLKYVCILPILATIANLVLPTLYATLIHMILWPIMVILIFKVSILKGILSEVIVYAITSCLDFIVSKIIFAIFHMTTEEIMVIPFYRLTIALSIYFIMWLLSVVIHYFKININIFDGMSKKTKTLLVTNTILVVIVIAMQFYLIYFYSDTMPAFITFISILSLLAYFAISIYSIINSSKLEIAARDLEGANLTIHSLRVLHDTVRTFKHDFDNIVNGIGGYIRNNDMDGLAKYYDQLLQDCNKTNNLYSLNPDVINHPAVYNILATKYYVADELNVQINLDIFLDLNEIEKHMKIYEFTRILGILLDNAIEAAKECDEKIINVTFRKEENKHRIIVIIENTYKNRDVDIDKIFEKGVSSKQGNSGLGLWKIRQILKKNNNLNLFTTKNNELFKQQFEIYY